MAESGNQTTQVATYTGLRVLLSPWAVLLSMCLGLLVGISFKGLAAKVAPYGRIYLSLLQMCVLPVMVAAVSSSLAGMMRSSTTRKSLKRMTVVFVTGLVLNSAIGLVGGLVGRPGLGLGESSQTVISNLVHESDVDRGAEINFHGASAPLPPEPGVMSYLVNVVPANIIKAMTEGQNLQVLFFAILLGVSISFVPGKRGDTLFDVLDSVYHAFSELIHGAMYLLPVGLFCLMADETSKIGVEILVAMLKFVGVFYVTGIILLVLNTVIIARRAGVGFGSALVGLKEPVLVALATRNSLATIPSALVAMHENLRFERSNTNLLVPLSVTVCRFGNVFYFALATVFVAQLYGESLGLMKLGIALIASILAGMATSGTSGVLTLAMIGIVLSPLGLPLDAVLVLFIAIDPIVDPLRSLIIVHSACAATALVAECEKKAPEKALSGEGALEYV